MSSTEIDFKKYIRVDKKKKKHALFAPSAMDRTLGCPGWINLARKEGVLDVEDNNEHSVRGTNTHTLLEFFFKEGKAGIKGVRSAAGIKFMKHIGYDSEMHQCALKAYNWVMEERERMYKRVGIMPTMLIERKVYLDHLVDADCNGTADVILYHLFGVLHIIDYKNGTSVVQAEDNAQMQTYALGFLDELGWDFKEVWVTIIQPNGPTDTYIRTWKTTINQMKNFQTKIRLGVKAAKKKDAPLKADSKYCFFCPAKAKCPEQKEKSRKKTHEKFLKRGKRR